ncbi:diaminopimelate decarboxylase [Haloterrigena turkmenica DSM 5511]|uniref:Diaminopimelate decarboxylase n=1 Tax=Haloterrigena turkmenica (strain ATCC 51198 / DSM 5511 / JCM 9101 / NCIMB 13204 / VKM B-1734 / 4k) TaxID=543526 RepID=D2RX75_HALTV|nr:diaminopimelate decarboxylase [Haloterrigena turkmenica]ADB59687.1 diaminopimelate decarboxylase [Haloterrigena turkmenica DSM 5511]
MSTLADSPAIRRLADWDATRLESLVGDYGSPLYALDLERVRENYRRLASAFPDAEIMYAVKANALDEVLETLHEEGAGLECASAGEVKRALAAIESSDRSDGSGADVHYTAVNPPARDLDWVVDAWEDHPELTITVGAEDTIDRLEERGYDGRLCLRVNPGIDAGHHEKVKTGAAAKFGVPIERAVDVLTNAADRGFDVVGVHAHVGSGVSSDQLDDHRAFVARMGELATDVDEALEGDLEFVDVGGGFGVPYRESEAPLDLEAVAEATREALGDVDARLTIEPGRYFVADAGVLLTEVNTIKEARDTLAVGVDAGMTTLLRPAMYDAYHPIRNLTADREADSSDETRNSADTGRETVPQTIAGPICESGDVFCSDRELPASRRTDVLAIGNAGAYGYEMANQYNSRPRPASVVIDGDDVRLARRRETVDDVTRPETSATDPTTADASRNRNADADREAHNDHDIR